MSHWGLHKGGGGGAMSGSSADRLLVRRLVRLGECGVDVLPHGRHIVRQRRDAGGLAVQRRERLGHLELGRLLWPDGAAHRRRKLRPMGAGEGNHRHASLGGGGGGGGHQEENAVARRGVARGGEVRGDGGGGVGGGGVGVGGGWGLRWAVVAKFLLGRALQVATSARHGDGRVRVEGMLAYD